MGDRTRWDNDRTDDERSARNHAAIERGCDHTSSRSPRSDTVDELGAVTLHPVSVWNANDRELQEALADLEILTEAASEEEMPEPTWPLSQTHASCFRSCSNYCRCATASRRPKGGESPLTRR